MAKLFTNQTFLAVLGILIGLFACMTQIYAPEIRCATVGDCTGRNTQTPILVIATSISPNQTPVTSPTVFATPTNRFFFPTFAPRPSITPSPRATLVTLTAVPPTLTLSPTVTPTYTPIIIILPTQTRTLTSTLTITATATITRPTP